MAHDFGLRCLEKLVLRVQVCFEEGRELGVRRHVLWREAGVCVYLCRPRGARDDGLEPCRTVKVDRQRPDVVHAPDDIVDLGAGEVARHAVDVQLGDVVALNTDEERELVGVRGPQARRLEQERLVCRRQVCGSEVGQEEGQHDNTRGGMVRSRLGLGTGGSPPRGTGPGRGIADNAR